MASRGRIRPNSRPTGLIVAGAIALMLAGVVLLVAINSKTRPKSDGNELPIDISATPPGGGDVVDISAQATGRFQAVDKDDPTRVAWELLFAKLDPIGAGVYRLSEPRAWIYLKDGQTLFVRADSAQIKKPAAIDGQIESGEFVGNTIAMVFPKRADAEGSTGASVWDPDRDIPWLLARTHSVKFDTVLLELSSDTPVKISTREAQFDGATMLVRGNQVRNRLEYMKIGGPGTIRYTVPSSNDSAGSTTNATTPSTADATTAANDATDDEAAETEAAGTKSGLAKATDTKATRADTANSKAGAGKAESQPEEFYRAVFSREVVLVQTGRKLNADMLELWARIIDNKFPAGAFGETVHAAYVPPATSTFRHTLTSWNAHHANHRPSANTVKELRYRLELAADVSIAAGETLFRPTGDDIVLNWGASGDLAITPLLERPGELVPGNDLLGRFTAAQTGRVKFQDRATGAVGQSGIVEYAATPRTLTLRTDAPRDTRRAWVHLPGSGLYTGEHVDVGFSTGKVRMTGEGLLASIRGTETSQDVFAGIALATPESLARLAQTRRMTWRERADFQFATRDGVIDDQLQRATFLGAVRAEDDRSALEAEQMEADFVRAATAAAASVQSTDGTDVAQGSPPQTARRATPAIRVFGAGKFTHALPEKDRTSPTDPTTFEVTWTKSMFFDDAPADLAESADGDAAASFGLGRIECDGDTVATGSGPFALDVVRSHRVRVDLGRVNGDAAAGQDAVVGDRRIVRIEAIGASFERDGGKNASIESRRYAPGETIASDSKPDGGTDTGAGTVPSRRLEQIVYLDGPRIIADDVEGTLRVPSEGRALFVDQRMAESAGGGVGGTGTTSTSPVSGVATGDLRGTTKFEWQGSMVYQRATGIVNLLDTVEMVHKPLDNQPFARLTCNELEALVGTGEPARDQTGAAGSAVSVRAGKLTRATAIGNVYIESQDRKKLVAERATYDAERSIIEASAEGANLVSMFDESQAVPMVARKMRWDLAGDRIEITEPAPTTVPR